jgi:hypothetical protein
MVSFRRFLFALAFGATLGAAAQTPDVLLKDPGYRLLAKLRADGTLVDGVDKVLGRLLRDGAIQDGEHRTVAVVDKGGFATDGSGRALGRIREDGTVLNAAGKELGTISPNGLVLSAGYDTLGHVEGEGWDPQQMAVLWFFCRETVLPKEPLPPPKKEGAAVPKDEPKGPPAKSP